MKASSQSTKLKKLKNHIESNMIKSVFNSDFFSIYEGIIETIDNINGLLNVRIPELENTLYKDCRVMTFSSSSDISFTPAYKIGNHVIVGFKMFSLDYPIILGQISPINTINTPFTDDTVTLKVGTGTLVMNKNSITLKCGDTSLVISESGITLSGQYITANDNDLTEDDIGVM